MTRPDDVSRSLALVLVALGGFAGSLSRWVTAGAVGGLGGTLAVNALGSVVLGALVSDARLATRLSPATRLAVAAGFVSSFTTYSTFVVQTVEAPDLAAAYVVATYALGFAGVFAGRALATRAWRSGVADTGGESA